MVGFLAPYRWFGVGPDTVLTHIEGKPPGIYLWGLQHGRVCCTPHVGATNWPMKDRRFEHLWDYLSGIHRNYDAERLMLREKLMIWGRKRRQEDGKLFNEFVSQCPEVTGFLHDGLRTFQRQIVKAVTGPTGACFPIVRS